MGVGVAYSYFDQSNTVVNSNEMQVGALFDWICRQAGSQAGGVAEFQVGPKYLSQRFPSKLFAASAFYERNRCETRIK